MIGGGMGGGGGAVAAVLVAVASEGSAAECPAAAGQAEAGDGWLRRIEGI